MCGFTGYANFIDKIHHSKSVIQQMNASLSKRGPDEDGYYYSNYVHLAHKRLIVIDPEGGKQPMIEHYSYGDYIICYNGQIYNTKELKNTLIENGFEINTHSDTEILLKSYIHFGNSVVNYLNGIFAFAIFNTKKEELFIARDHFGVKPFFIQYKIILLYLHQKLRPFLNFLVLKKLLTPKESASYLV